MANLILLLQEYGVLIVFGVVLVEQIGLPIPAFPILIVAGAFAVDGGISWPAALAVSLLACLISDYFWFRAGRYFGKRILRLLCQISLSPDYCVSQTEDNFNRWGPKALVVAKFIPGFNTIAPPLAGALGTSNATFLGFSVAGALLWSGTGIALGAAFHTQIDQVLDILNTMGSTALMVLGALLLLFIVYKYVERRRFRQTVDIERLTIEELKRLLAQGPQPVLVDARSVTAQMLDPAVPGALAYSGGDPIPELAALDKDYPIIVYCSCPNDVTAAQVAKHLVSHGFHRARPLHGGLEAWKAEFGSTTAQAEAPAH